MILSPLYIGMASRVCHRTSLLHALHVKVHALKASQLRDSYLILDLLLQLLKSV